MIGKIKKTLNTILLTILIVTLFVLGLNDIKMPMIAEGDAYSRALIAKEMFDQHQLFQFDNTSVWLPLHFSLINFPALFGIEIFFGQRFITMVIGIASVLSMYFYTRELTGKKTVALLSSAFFAFFPLRFFLSTQTLSEGIFVAFFLIALYFLLQKQKTLTTDLLFIISFSAASLIRFESWFFVPMIIGYVVLSPEFTKKRKLTYLSFPIIAPILWIISSSKSEAEMFSFFFEKYSMAQSNPNPNFYNWQLSWRGWESQLQLIFPSILVLACAPQFTDLFKDLNPKKVFLYLTPVYLFATLVLQVFLGTMEWFPARYLLIPTTFLFPILALSTVNGLIFSYNFLKRKQLFWQKVFMLVFLSSFIFIIYQDFLRSQDFTYKQLTIASFLSLPNASHISEEDYEKIYSFNSLKNFIEKNSSESSEIDYFYSENNRSWQDQALFYQLKRPGKDLAKSTFSTVHNIKNVIIWEREPDKKEPHWQSRFKILFENYHYYIITFE